MYETIELCDLLNDYEDENRRLSGELVALRTKYDEIVELCENIKSSLNHLDYIKGVYDEENK